jgi:hypothetical protein
MPSLDHVAGRKVDRNSWHMGWVEEHLFLTNRLQIQAAESVFDIRVGMAELQATVAGKRHLEWDWYRLRREETAGR